MLLMHRVWLALALARERAGSSIEARMAMMAITTSNSIKVKALNPGPPATVPAVRFVRPTVGIGRQQGEPVTLMTHRQLAKVQRPKPCQSQAPPAKAEDSENPALWILNVCSRLVLPRLYQ